MRFAVHTVHGRGMQHADLSGIGFADLRQQLEQLLATDLKVGLTVSLEHLQEAYTSPFADLVFVFDVENPGKLVGYAELHAWHSATGRAGYIENVVRHRAYKGKGVGALLGEELLAAAKRSKLKTVWLHSGAWRTSAQKLYDELGFSTKETIVRYKEL